MQAFDGPRNQTGRARRLVLAALAIAAGAVWCVLLPKSGSLADPDFAASVAIGTGLVGLGVLLVLEERLGRPATVLAMLLLVSSLANGVLWVVSGRLAETAHATVMRAEEGR